METRLCRVNKRYGMFLRSAFVAGCMEVFDHAKLQRRGCGALAMIVSCTLPDGNSCLYLIKADHLSNKLFNHCLYRCRVK